jgi:type II secretory pathway component GspD/PulD (secretin)
MKRPGLLFLACLLATFTLQAASLTTIQLRNRPAAEVIPIVEPFLDAGEQITGAGFKIFLRASPTTVEQVREIVDAVDIAAKMLQISVFQGSQRKLREMSASGFFEIDNGNVSIGVGDSNASGAGNIGFSDGNVSAGGRASDIRQDSESNPVHRLRVADGSEGFIQTGSQVAYDGGDGGTTFKDVTTGFYVLPRIHGDNVTLQVRPFRNSPGASAGGVIETQSAETVITGRVGEWLRIGGVSEHSSQSQSGGAGYSSSSSSRKDRIWIRADPVR